MPVFDDATELAHGLPNALSRISIDVAAQLAGVSPGRIYQISDQLGGRFESDGSKSFDRQLVIQYAAVRRARRKTR